MMTEAVRVLADWFADGTYGINAIVASVPRETDIDPPDTITIYDETRDREVAREQMPDTLPALLVSTAATPIDQVNPGNQPYPADMNVDVLVRYAVKDTDTAKVTCESGLVVRAILRSLNRFMRIATTQKVRNDVHVYHIARVAVQNMYQANNDNVVTVGVLVTLVCRDVHAINSGA